MAAPSYLSIEGWINCVGSTQPNRQTYSQYCLPPEKPTSCTSKAWNAMQIEFQNKTCPEDATGKIYTCVGCLLKYFFHNHKVLKIVLSFLACHMSKKL